MAAGDIYELTYNLTYGAQNIANVFHFVQVGGDGAGDARDAVNDMFVAEFMPEYLVGLSDALVSVGTRCRRLLPTQTQALTNPFTNAGSLAVPGIPPNQAGLIRTYGPLTQAIPPALGTRGIGRILIAGLPEEDVNRGRVNADQITWRNLFANKLENDQDDGVTAWVWHAAVLSRVDNIARKINIAGMTTQVKNLYSRTRSA